MHRWFGEWVIPWAPEWVSEWASEWVSGVSQWVCESVSEWVSEWVSRINLPANIYLFKVNNRNTGKTCKISSKLTIKIPESRRWRHSDVFIFNFEHILHLLLEFIVDFDQVYASWVHYYIQKKTMTYILEN